ncbi:phosphate ABC transporter permease subunit PstC [Arthrobacter sp. BB-1]|uniref:phosphate ABC transporter permease subunit PstC n=1 Tax=unclassified Arthrobacter TaxID=235627 RepID=UPI0011129F1B|nr:MULTISPECIES: phosphate ABC transporter permease subunit PstC [unclassified Arthrobacter]TNB67703.1 phosphate ABC transporter permease subunit PstC [Arthrobacter sp. BB-1]
MSSPRPEVTEPSAPRDSAGPKAAAPDQTPSNSPAPTHGPGSSAAPVFKHGSVLGDRIFRGISTAAGLSVIAVIVLIAVFLLVRAIPSLQANTVNFFFSSEFNTTDAENLAFGIRDLLIVTVLSSAFALVLAVPVAVGIAIFLTQYAPRRLAHWFGNLVDLLAAVPSIVFGLWGIFILAPWLEPLAKALNSSLGWFPLFATGNVSLNGGGTIFTAGIVLAVMILPIITAITREVYKQTPGGHIEAAQALGATKWEVVKMTVLPFGRSGTIAAAMLGLGRALGETVAVLIILRASAQAASFTLFDGGYTFASKIASAAAEFSAPLPTGAYIAAGFVLFALTFVVNALARSVVGKKVNG